MNSILFVLPSFKIGGTTVSTLNLIKLLRKKGWDCSVLPLQNEGELAVLYADINIVSSPRLLQYLSAPSYRSANTVVGKVTSAVVRYLSNHSDWFFRSAVNKSCQSIDRNSYVAIVATQEGFPTKVVAGLSHPNRIAWVRCDYANYLLRSNRIKESFYNSFNAIVCVSNQGLKSFTAIYPDLKNRVFSIPNPQDSHYIIERANVVEKDSLFIKNGFTIVSVGRLDPVKRYEEIPRIAKQLIDRGIKFKWYIIGDGVERRKIEDQIMKWGVADDVVLLGVKTNPHYYINKSDLFVCLSSSESCPRVVNEAKILGTPTVSTDFPSIYEFVEDGKTGWIGELNTISDLIENAINNKNEYLEVVHNLESFEFDNTLLISKIERLLTGK